jgi:hypothetical protein
VSGAVERLPPSSRSTGFAGLERGDAFDRFRLLEKPRPKGATSCALAYDPKLDRRVALYVLAPRASAFGRERVAHAIRLLSQSSNPGLLALLDAGAVAGEAFTVVEAPSAVLDDYLASLPPWRAVAASLLDLAPVVEELARAGFGGRLGACIGTKGTEARIDVLSLAAESRPEDGDIAREFVTILSRSLARAEGDTPPSVGHLLERAVHSPDPVALEDLARELRQLAELEDEVDARRSARLRLVAGLLLVDAVVPIAIDLVHLGDWLRAPFGATMWAMIELVAGLPAWRALARHARPGARERSLFNLLLLGVCFKPVESLGLSLLGAPALFPSFHLAIRALLAGTVAALLLPSFGLVTVVFALTAVLAVFVPERGLLILGVTQVVYAGAFVRSAREWERQ